MSKAEGEKLIEDERRKRGWRRRGAEREEERRKLRREIRIKKERKGPTRKKGRAEGGSFRVVKHLRSGNYKLEKLNGDPIAKIMECQQPKEILQLDTCCLRFLLFPF